MEAIKRCEEQVKTLADGLKESLGASSVEISVIADKYTKGVRTIVRFENQEPRDATANRPANSGPVC